MKLIAVKDHTPDGSRKLKAGEPFEISDGAAKLLVASGLAKYAEEAPQQPKAKGSYKRRDMTAEKP